MVSTEHEVSRYDFSTPLIPRPSYAS